MPDNDLSESLRAALKESVREKEAVENIFEEDTGADNAAVEFYNSELMTVTLTYKFS